MNTDQKSVVFFDGVCGLCNRFVDFVIRRDQQQIFLFSPLQGQTAERDLPAEMREEMRSIVLLEAEGQLYDKSDAALRVLAGLPGIWRGSKMMLWVPRFIRDLVYDLVAANRYRVFGKRDQCRLPTPEERSRFLD